MTRVKKKKELLPHNGDPWQALWIINCRYILINTFSELVWDYKFREGDDKRPMRR